MYRGLLVLHSTRALCEKKGLDFEQRCKGAVVLGWCIEVVSSIEKLTDVSLTWFPAASNVLGR